MLSKYKNNVIVEDLYPGNKISSGLDVETSIIKAKYSKARYPNGLTDSLVKSFH